MDDIVEGIQKYHDNGDDSFSKWVWIHGSDVSLGGGGSVTQGTTPWVDSLQASTLSGATLQSAATSTGNGTDFSLAGMAEAKLTVTITGGTATVTLTGSEDGTTFPFSVSADQPNSKPSNAITASGGYTVHVAGLQKLRAAITAISGATVTVTAHAAPIPTSPFLTKDSNGNLLESLGTLLAGEDLTNNVLATARKHSAASAYAPSLYTNFAAATKANIKNAAGTVVAATITNANAAVRYFQIHNKASAPAGTDVPIFSFPVPAGTAAAPGSLILTADLFNDYFLATGVGWAISTTVATFTDSATAGDHVTHVEYV